MNLFIVTDKRENGKVVVEIADPLKVNLLMTTIEQILKAPKLVYGEQCTLFIIHYV